MWEYIVLGIFIIALQLALVMWGGWLTNFTMGCLSIVAVVYYYNLIPLGLPLDYFLPLVMVVFTIMLWISALSRSEVIA